MCDLAATAATDTICADSNRVLVLLHARHTDQSSMHMFVNGLLRSISVEHRDCIYMQQGVLWVDAVLLPQQPRKRERETMLQRVETHANARNGRLTSPAQLPSPGIWRRQRHVLTGSPRQDMRVELLLRPDAVPLTVEVDVGLDDLQGPPVVSRFPHVLHGASLFAAVDVPSQPELKKRGVQDLPVGNQTHEDVAKQAVNEGVETTEPGQ